MSGGAPGVGCPPGRVSHNANLAQGDLPCRSSPREHPDFSLLVLSLPCWYWQPQLRLRGRLREPLVRPSLLDDAAIRAIEVRGSVEIDDEPLDPAEIEEEERRFWEEEQWE